MNDLILGRYYGMDYLSSIAPIDPSAYQYLNDYRLIRYEFWFTTTINCIPYSKNTPVWILNTEGDVKQTGNLLVEKNLTVQENATVQQNVTVNKNTEIIGSLRVNDTVSFENTLTVSDDVKMKKDLYVDGNIFAKSISMPVIEKQIETLTSGSKVLTKAVEELTKKVKALETK